ncbi:ATP synthase F1 subunit epsilon [Verticiella sediminum]|uniref:ATP synthase epsilon chain n=2 Tax=Verticiella sediminum TaxID=1247510 RepID=A0A556A8G3_9BURK|nr:ATP synthase F1 subunit epsilon [Verticiella sediminum]
MAETLYSGDAAFVSVPGVEGSLGVYPGHTPLLTKVREGFVQVRQLDGGQTRVYVAGGFIEVMPHAVTVLADVAVRTEELDATRAREAASAASPLARELARPDYAAVHAELIDDISLRRLRRE